MGSGQRRPPDQLLPQPSVVSPGLEVRYVLRRKELFIVR
jgi:hypothetical protein